jgi:hypothetical protein
MKRKANSIILGLCVALIAIAASPAYARSTTAFSAFHVESPLSSTQNPYLCLGEYNGVVLNNCSYAVSLEFDLPIDSTGSKSITVQNYWGGTEVEETFNCYSYVYNGSQPGTDGTEISFTGVEQSLTTTVNVPNGGDSIQVICWDVPSGGGVANFNWNP